MCSAPLDHVPSTGLIWPYTRWPKVIEQETAHTLYQWSSSPFSTPVYVCKHCAFNSWTSAEGCSTCSWYSSLAISAVANRIPTQSRQMDIPLIVVTAAGERLTCPICHATSTKRNSCAQDNRCDEDPTEVTRSLNRNWTDPLVVAVDGFSGNVMSMPRNSFS